MCEAAGEVSGEAKQQAVWTRILPDHGFKYRGLKPSCAKGPPFSFYARKGRLDKVVVFFEGGGACWDSSNCIGHPTYTSQVEENREEFSNGIFNLQNPLNPFRDWSFVIIPYCTGDLHIGANDVAYEYQGKTHTIRHRGFVNFRAVLYWMTENLRGPSKILVTGSSAGSYAALFNFAYLQRAYPGAECALLSDAGNGVVTEKFIRRALINWRLLENLPDWIPGVDQAFSNEFAFPQLFTDIVKYFPHKDMGQYTTAYDSVQIYFYNLMLCIDAGVYDPEVWKRIDSSVAADWNSKMLAHVHYVADHASNFGYYIGAGSDHTIMGLNKFFVEDSPGVPFEKWLNGILQGEKPERLNADLSSAKRN